MLLFLTLSRHSQCAISDSTVSSSSGFPGAPGTVVGEEDQNIDEEANEEEEESEENEEEKESEHEETTSEEKVL